jgi:transposase-like protein
MQSESPTHLTCPYCPAQAYLKRKCFLEGLRYGAVRYECSGGHRFWTREEDPSFNFGHNKKEREEDYK